MGVEQLLFDDGLTVNNKLMELAMERQRVIANNIANANTPGYIRQDLEFEGKLKKAIKSGRLEQLQGYKGELVEDHTNTTRSDGNNVTIPQEMHKMMSNSSLYTLLSRAYKARMNVIREAIK